MDGKHPAWGHFVGDIVNPADAFAEALGNAVNGHDTIERGVHDQPVGPGVPWVNRPGFAGGRFV